MAHNNYENVRLERVDRLGHAKTRLRKFYIRGEVVRPLSENAMLRLGDATEHGSESFTDKKNDLRLQE